MKFANIFLCFLKVCFFFLLFSSSFFTFYHKKIEAQKFLALSDFKFQLVKNFVGDKKFTKIIAEKM